MPKCTLYSYQSLFTLEIFYEFKVYTSAIAGAGTEANVFAELTGPRGQTTGRVHLKGAFNKQGPETLLVDMEDVGEPLQSLRIGHDGGGRDPAWHLDSVEVSPIGSSPVGLSPHCRTSLVIYAPRLCVHGCW